MNKMYLVLVAILCLTVTTVLFSMKTALVAYDINALLGANIILAVLSIISYIMIQRKMKQERAQAFVNGVYSASLLRLMICLGSVFAYAYSTRAHLHKPSVFAMMGLYVLYTLVETLVMSKIVKK
jgi:hypothetical protein